MSSKKIFLPSKELLGEKILYKKEDVDPFYPLDFYSIDRVKLLKIRNKESYQSNLIFDELQSDQGLLISLTNTIQRLCNVVAGKKVNITLAELEKSNEGSYASYNGDKIVLSLEVLTDIRIPFHVRINCLLSTAAHESFHVKFTTPDSGNLLIKSGYVESEILPSGRLKIKPNYERLKEIIDSPLLGILINILEDRRIEDLGLELFNGFIFNFDDKKQYAGWLQLNALSRKPYISSIPIDEKYQYLLKFILFHVLLPGISKEAEGYFPKDKDFIDLYKEVISICKVRETDFEKIVNQAERLLKLFPNHLHNKIKNPNYSELTGTPLDKESSNSIKIPLELLEELNKILGSEKEKIPFPKEFIVNSHDKRHGDYKLEIPSGGSYDPSIYKQAQHLAGQISKNLSFLDSRFNRVNQMFELNSGEIDEDELHKINYATSLFYEEEDVPGYSLDIAVLLDESGSMHGKKIEQAKITGLALALAFCNSSYINLFLYGHSTDRPGKEMILYKYINSKEKKFNLNSIFSAQARNSNLDGYAIGAVGGILSKQGTSKQKLLIVVSDGRPAGAGYGGSEAAQHVKETVNKLEKQNIFVIQIAIDSVNSADMFKHYISYNEETLGNNLKKVLLKKLTQISLQV